MSDILFGCCDLQGLCCLSDGFQAPGLSQLLPESSVMRKAGRESILVTMRVATSDST